MHVFYDKTPIRKSRREKWDVHETCFLVVETKICEHLDRALATASWCEQFPKAIVLHLTASHSDHVPLLINTNGEEPSDRRKKQREEV